MPKANNMTKANNKTNITITKTTLIVSGKLEFDKEKIKDDIIEFINNFNHNELDSNFKPNATNIILNKKPSDIFAIIM
jgi:flagellar capping protein FliD